MFITDPDLRENGFPGKDYSFKIFTEVPTAWFSYRSQISGCRISPVPCRATSWRVGEDRQVPEPLYHKYPR
jgi:hypothetical protein